MAIFIYYTMIHPTMPCHLFLGFIIKKNIEYIHAFPWACFLVCEAVSTGYETLFYVLEL